MPGGSAGEARRWHQRGQVNPSPHPPVPPRIIVLGCGNPSRGDDALGPLLVERVGHWIRLHPDKPVAAVEDFQFQVEHCLDLEDRELALFLDAAASGPEPYALARLQPLADASFSTHALTPQAVLHAYRALGHGEPPPSFLLAVRGRSFELGEDLSPEARSNLEATWAMLEQLLETASLDHWDRLCTPSAQGLLLGLDQRVEGLQEP
ncbi:MAG: hydrogenase maturation protease [Holophagaceae bacterium]|nr:hydrogenase maturation protease [Holophagaceae bacterium]